jgi:hypothetical protein
MIPAADFIALLKTHPWGFESADGDPYHQGLASQRKLLYLCQQQPELFRLYNHAENRFIRSLPFDFQSITGNSVKDEKQHTQTHHHPMKEIFTLFFDICIKPLVDAINNLAAGALGAPPPQPETPTPVVEKPVKAKTPKAAGPAPTPEPEPEQPEAPAISETRLRETVKTLPNEGKAKLKAYFVKKFGYNTMAEIAPEHYADIHAAAIKIGAVDTDPDAPAEDVDLG